jgi:hypothetical protein
MPEFTSQYISATCSGTREKKKGWISPALPWEYYIMLILTTH